MGPRVYLAGPDVFFPEPERWFEQKKAICERYGLTGVSPLDSLAKEPATWAALPFWRMIALRNEAHIGSCQAVIANLTPFRGPSADVGTVYEVGFARAKGLKVFAYATTDSPFLVRILTALGPAAHRRADGSWLDGEGLLVEQFGLFDNLMIEGGIAESGGLLITGDADRWGDLSLFEQCVLAAAKQTGSPEVGPSLGAIP
ncbi:MAG: nucleoside 2-deoxyribosyltransferase [Acetobacteraceae bacterium]|nr:nucleoside 2-deoxyribosyltransferase [Acetobacteraceae bacterium]